MSNYFHVILFFRNCNPVETAPNVSEPSAVSNECISSPSHEEAILASLMDRWGLTDPDSWKIIFASQAESTRKQYRSNFLKFLQFILPLGVTVETAQLQHVFGFLKPYVQEKSAASTLRSYVAALKFYFTLFERTELVESKLFSFFAAGAQKLAPLPKRKVCVWNAAIPLQMIRDRSHPQIFLDSAREALFLLLMATGLRIDDVFKMGEEFCFEDADFVIPFVEKRKCKIKGSWSLVQKLKRYNGSARLCPVTAILLYSTFAVTVKKPGVTALFVSSTGERASKATLSRWVKELLIEAKIDASGGSCRSASTSAAYIRSLPIDVILSSAGWSSRVTFFRYYQREVNENGHEIATNLLPEM